MTGGEKQNRGLAAPAVRAGSDWDQRRRRRRATPARPARPVRAAGGAGATVKKRALSAKPPPLALGSKLNWRKEPGRPPPAQGATLTLPKRVSEKTPLKVRPSILKPPPT